MTGKDFKAWAETIPDVAIIETTGERYGGEWHQLDENRIRAVLMPPLTMDQVNNLEDVRS